MAIGSFKVKYALYLVIFYLVLAFAWWTVLLNVKNEDAFEAKKQYMKLVMIAQGEVQSDQEFELHPDYLDLKWNYEKGRYMIYGEAFFFVLSLSVAIYFMGVGYFSEMRSAKQKRNFMLSITHELKSPLASMLLTFETLLKRDLPNEKVKKLSKNGIKESQRLSHLVENILLAARVESDYVLNTENENLNVIIEQCVAQQKHRFPNLDIELELDESIPKLDIDRMAIQSILINLIENAAKYNDEQSPQINVITKSSKNKTLLLVKDNGPGIPNEEKNYVFEKFYRVGNEDTRKSKGTGIGLYLVKEFVKLHKGKITILDNSPKGSIFKIEM